MSSKSKATVATFTLVAIYGLVGLATSIVYGPNWDIFLEAAFLTTVAMVILLFLWCLFYATFEIFDN